MKTKMYDEKAKMNEKNSRRIRQAGANKKRHALCFMVALAMAGVLLPDAARLGSEFEICGDPRDCEERFDARNALEMAGGTAEGCIAGWEQQ